MSVHFSFFFFFVCSLCNDTVSSLTAIELHTFSRARARVCVCVCVSKKISSVHPYLVTSEGCYLGYHLICLITAKAD